MTTQKIAVFLCNGAENCLNRFIYEGIKTCAAAEMLYGGQKSCSTSCLGFGDCALKCGKKAIFQRRDKMPGIDEGKCDGCGDCLTACPKNIIALINRQRNVQIRCLSVEKSNYIRQVCRNGCISCGICEKVCPQMAIMSEGCIAKIDYEKCDFCGICVEKCPTNSISRIIVQ